MIEKEKLNLRFAAFLHDIGKFWQGTGEKFDTKLYTDVKYGHPKWSAKFMRMYFPELELAESLVLYHHQPEKSHNKLLTKIIQVADWLSSGERREEESYTNEGEGRLNASLESIFSEIDIGKGKPKTLVYSLRKLELNESIFPKEKKRVDGWLQS